MAMLTIRVYAFTCDYPGCEAQSDDYIPLGSERQPARWARAQARRDGWSFGSKYVAADYCPRHAAEIKRQSGGGR